MAVDDVDLLAYADGQLSPERRAEVEAAVANSAEAAARLRAMGASALPYAAAFEAQSIPAVPRALRGAVAALVRADRQRGSRNRWAFPRLAAAFAAGILCCAVGVRLLGPATHVEPWIQAVAEYQRMYSRATVINVTEDPRLSAKVIADLAMADGMKVVVPDLSTAGLTFKRVQRLSFHGQPVVQMVYLPAQGEPLALCVTRDARPDEAPRPLQTGELSSVAWRRGNLGYVLLGKAPAQGLMDLARRVADGKNSGLYGRVGSDPKGDPTAAARTPLRS